MDKEVQDLKKKNALLKKAIFKERSEKQSDLLELEQLQNTITILEQTTHEKDSQLTSYQREKRNLEEEILELRQKNKNLGSPRKPSKKNLALLEQQNKKYLEDYHFLRQQNSDLQNMCNTLSNEYQQMRQADSSKESSFKKAKDNLLVSLKNSMQQKEAIEGDIRDSQYSNNSLKETGQRLEKELVSLRANLQTAEEEIETLKNSIQEKQGSIASLSESLIKYGENEGKLSSKLMQYKNELADSENYFQRHEVVKINNLINHNAVIILKRDHTGDFVIEIEDKRGKTVHSMRDVNRVMMIPNSETRFSITFLDNSQLEFQSPEAEYVSSKIGTFLERAIN